ncbi:plasmid pRiA4b ORF-3 family protein [Lysinibacillus endophyticus]|uniref:plasmid pRiA4b ORF-3 family protein n=1 Tax=Ureibacillus endophyticus TaxID=1978490 RepID=UPI00209FEEAE|nr:plasmid pRiA4b ORF-3 family protein [Lysinibacillus endophyticus]MCP1143688.1 plasmid pRiA4b ORF-3 family protein [Lysinibacillus endophyticus]
MIFQFKITLKDSKPPIWRRFEVKDTMTFYDLHKIIQIGFDWMDSHLHGFDVRKSNGYQIHLGNRIGPILDDDFGFSRCDYDEEVVQLKDIFKKEKDRVLYTYDYGDDWEHEILLEKILPTDKKAFYPRCTKVMRDTPMEDSRFLYFETGIVTEAVNGKLFMEEYNEILKEAFTKDESENSKIEWSKLLYNVDRYKDLQPWKWMSDDQIFIIQDPETEEFIYCSILGKSGIEYGLAAFIGDEGHTFLQGLSKKENANPHFYMKQRSLHLSFSNRDELETEDYKLLKAFGRSYFGKKQWPQMRSFKPGYYPWFLNEEEVRLFSIVLDQTVKVCEMAKKNPDLIGINDGTHYFARAYNKKKKKWESGEITLYPNENYQKNLPLYINDIELMKLKKIQKRLNTSVEFDCRYFATPIQDFPDEQPYFPKLLLAVDKKRGLVLFNEFMEIQNEVEAVQKGFVQFIIEMESIPREVFVNEETAHSIMQIAKSLNIKLIVVNSLPVTEEVYKEIDEMMRKGKF